MIRIACLFFALAALARPAVALESAPVRSARATATLISDSDAVQPGTPVHLALRLRLAPGWHTYWQNPGDAGVPAELSWTLPPGATVSGIAWPTPIRQAEGPLMTYAYTGEVVLPVTVTPGAEGLDVEASATWLVCERICVPEQGTFRLSLPVGTPSASVEAPLFAAAAAREPRPSPFDARVAADGTLSVAGVGLSSKTVKDAWFLPSEAGLIDQAAVQRLQVEDGMVRLSLTPGSAFKPAASLEGVLVLRDPGGQESDLQVVAQPGGAVAVAASPLWQTLALALVAGLLLNLMPCVFPVLAMKAVALSRLSGAARGVIRLQAIAYTGGVLFAFLALGGVLSGLRAAGSAVGWGFQFQSPVFVAAMALVLFAVGLNLSGVFQVGGGRLAGTGDRLVAQGGLLGSFFTGLLAVVVAAPCTAPFMGAAIATALAAPAVVTMAVFLALGLGLALPYVVLALAPGFARVLPRPGAWMDVLKGAMAFPMYGAAAWLVWVISLQAGPGGVLAVAAAMVLVGFGAWVFGLAQASGRRFGYGLAVVAVCCAAALLPGITSAAAPALVTSGDVEPFTPLRLAALRAEGRPVFVNMTAAWCVTCLINERLALSPEAVKQAFAARHVAYLKGDWTQADPAITAFLREHARDGVPLYVLYPAGPGAPRVLPQILTEADMLAELRSSGG